MPGSSNGAGERVIDEGFLLRYRELLDAEEQAFDELEHAFEEGNRAHFQSDLAELQRVIEAKQTFLERRGLPVPQREVLL